MCSLWYENNQFGYNEIKIKGKFEQKQIYCDRLCSSGNLKAAVVAAWNSIKLFPLKGRKQALISPTMLTAWRKTGNHDSLQRHQYYPCYPLVAVEVIDTARQQSDLHFDRLECETTLVCLVVTLVWSPLEYITRCHHLHLPPLCVRENPYMHSIYSTRANQAHFMAEQRPIWLAQPAAAEVNSDRMDGSVRGRNGRIVLHWRRNWLCSLG